MDLTFPTNVPNSQALCSNTFTQPPLDGSLTLPEIFDWHYTHSPSHPLFAYYSEDEARLRMIHYREAVPAMRRIAKHYQSLFGSGIDDVNENASMSRIVAIVAASDTISYYTVIHGLIMAGFVVFPISPRNSPWAVTHLLTTSSVAHVLVGDNDALRKLVQTALSIMGEEMSDARIPKTSDMLTFADIYSSTSQLPPSRPWILMKPSLKSAALILHSSGSTSFPKAITWSHADCIKHTLTPYFASSDLCGVRFALHATPMFHAMGARFSFYMVSAGIVATVFEPRVPAILPTAEKFLTAIHDTESEYGFMVPSFLEAWSQDAAAIPILARMKGAFFGGGPISREAGDCLVSKGVSLIVLYGSTECGLLSQFAYEPRREWDYFPISPALNVLFEFQADDNSVAELVVRSDGIMSPVVTNSQRGGISVYATADLLERHPTVADLWRVYGRADDQIVQSNGEKTNPVPIERIICGDPRVQACVMFGRGRLHPGILVEPKPAHQFDPSDTIKLAEFRNVIWPIVEKANDFAPQHSRLFKEAILVATPSKPFTFTAKNTVRRHAVLAEYESEINAMYALIAESTQAGGVPPSSWTLEDTRAFVRGLVSKVMKKQVGDDEDIFAHGCDSLQATWIRNSILHVLRESSSVNTRVIPHSLVYQHPTISQLSIQIVSSCDETAGLNSGPASTVMIEASVQQMLAMAKKYSKDFLVHGRPSTPKLPSDAGDVILLTGTTGGLGACLLAELIRRDDVHRVYGLNRKATIGNPLLERQRKVFFSRGLDTKLLESPKVVLLEGKADEPGLGLEQDTLTEMRDSVTHIIHNAWRVDFNQNLSSFETNVKSLRNLIDLGLTSQLSTLPHLLFISSIGVFRNADRFIAHEELPLDPRAAQGSGYSESKWVGEKIIERLNASTFMKGTVVRAGQLCGSGGASGAWNTSEWVPAMMKASVAMGCLPKLSGTVSWLPLNIAARALADCRFQVGESRGSERPAFLHLVHPHPVPWPSLLSEFADTLNIPLVPYRQWFAKLEEADNRNMEDPLLGSHGGGQHEALPALLLMDTFRAAADASDVENGEAMGLPRLSQTKMLKCAPVLRKAPPLGKDDVHGWITGWKEAGFLS